MSYGCRVYSYRIVGSDRTGNHCMLGPAVCQVGGGLVWVCSTQCMYHRASALQRRAI